jgi:serine/threonine protein phosphatase 1
MAAETNFNKHFRTLALLGAPSRIWTVSAIHADAPRLRGLHDAIYERIRPGDRLVYLGNYFGQGPAPGETVDELLGFRRMVMALPGMMADDIVYLRGGHEDLWQKLLQVQFFPHPANALGWLLQHGLAAPLHSYGINWRDGVAAAREGVVALTRWTCKIRDSIRSRPGHDVFAMQWRRAAHTATESPAPILFVHAGIDPALPLEGQGDNFCWGGENFNDIHLPYDPFARVVRGYDPHHGGVHINGVTATIDGGCGYGGSLIGAGFDQAGNLFEMLEA